MKFLKSMATFSVKAIGYPLLVPVAVAHGLLTASRCMLKNIGWLIVSPLFAISVLNRGNSEEFEGHKFIPAMFGIAVTVVGGVGLVIFGLSQNDNETDKAIANWLLHYKPIILGFVATNILSFLYEGGRDYFNYLTGAKGKSEVPEAKVMAPQSHLTMMSKIHDKDKVSEEEGWTLLQEAIDIGKNGKMKLGDVPYLAQMVCDRAPTSAVVH